MSSHRYTGIPSASLNQLLDVTLASLSQDIEALRLPKLAAVILGGGYGRGEGGVWHTPQGDRLYNDLDFFVVAQNASRGELSQIDHGLATLSTKWERQLAVAVDFGPAKNLSQWKKVARTLMFQELRQGWHPVWGNINPETCLPEISPADLPITEAYRLMMNRGMGLLLAGEKLTADSAVMDADFIVRNLHKAALGSGDALLLAARLYRWSGFERQTAFQEYAQRQMMPQEFTALYQQAFQYKLEPQPILPNTPVEAWRQCRRFWLTAVQMLSSSLDTPETAVRQGLHLRAKAERSGKNFLRWALRARRTRPLASIFDAPVVTILGMLYEHLLHLERPAPIPPELMRLWKFFN